MDNSLGTPSAFLRLKCRNVECVLFAAAMVVERSTMVVLWCEYRIVNEEPAWPSHWMNRRGEQVLPEAGRVVG